MSEDRQSVINEAYWDYYASQTMTASMLLRGIFLLEWLTTNYTLFTIAVIIYALIDITQFVVASAIYRHMALFYEANKTEEVDKPLWVNLPAVVIFYLKIIYGFGIQIWLIFLLKSFL